MTLDEDTALDEVGTGRFAGMVSDRWGVIDDGPPNGGYVLALLLRAMAAMTPHPAVLTATAHYLRPAEPGPITIEAEVVKVGRQASTVRAVLHQDGARHVLATATFGDHGAMDGPTQVLQAPIDVPGPDACVGIEAMLAAGFEPPGVARRAGLSLHPDDVGFALGEPSGTGILRGWTAFEQGRPFDQYALAVALDAFPPALFAMGLPSGWAPTIELTIHVRHPGPLPGPLACQFQSRWATDGLVEEDGRIETADGTPVAMSRQLLLAPRPPRP